MLHDYFIQKQSELYLISNTFIFEILCTLSSSQIYNTIHITEENNVSTQLSRHVHLTGGVLRNIGHISIYGGFLCPWVLYTWDHL